MKSKPGKRVAKVRLTAKTIPYAIVSVDKLIDLAERLVKLEAQVATLSVSAVNQDAAATIAINEIAEYIGEVEDGEGGKRFYIRGLGDGKSFRCQLPILNIEEIP